MKDIKIYRCPHCGNIVLVLKDGGVTPLCCGQKMDLLTANTTEAALEKHVPEIVKDGESIIVKVGSVAHPMTTEHLIEWILVVDDKDIHVRHLEPGDIPEARFIGVKNGEAYAYCNLHGLWKAAF